MTVPKRTKSTRLDPKVRLKNPLTAFTNALLLTINSNKKEAPARRWSTTCRCKLGLASPRLAHPAHHVQGALLLE